MNKMVNTKADYVDIELTVNQRGDKFVGVGFGHSLEDTLKKTKERVENPPRVNVVVPVVNYKSAEGVNSYVIEYSLVLEKNGVYEGAYACTQNMTSVYGRGYKCDKNLLLQEGYVFKTTKGEYIEEEDVYQITYIYTKFELSNQYLSWLKTAEGKVLYPFRDDKDNQSMKNNKNVTIGSGVTFDITGRNWEMIKSETGWSDSDIRNIINTLYSGVDSHHFENSTDYSITNDIANNLFNSVVSREYIPNLSRAIERYKTSSDDKVIYTQRELEAMFDFSYNNGLSNYSLDVNNRELIIYYYLRKDLATGASKINQYGGGTRRRLNQMNLFFFDYDFLDKSGKSLNPLRRKLGIAEI